LTTAAAVTGGLVGLATQVLWLLDDHPRLNWTLPEPHRFNGAGIYHGVYLVIMSAVFAGLWISVVRRVRAAARASDVIDWPAVSAGVAVALISGGGFAALVVTDNQVSAGADSSKSTLVAIGTALVGVFGTGVIAVRNLRQRRRFRR